MPDVQTPLTAPAASDPAPATPAAEPASAPAPDPVVTSASSSSPEAAGAPSATPETPKTPADPTPDTFGWDSWRGEVDALPESVRPWMAKANDFYKRASDARVAEAEHVQKTYEQLLAGMPDPRVEKLQKELEDRQKALSEHEGSAKTWKEKAEALEKAHSEYVAAIQAQVEAEALAKTEAFKRQHAWIFSNDALQKAGGELLDEGFEPEHLPTLLRMPEPLLNRVREVNKDLVARGAKDAGDYAIRLARSEVKLAPENPSASLADASARTSVHHQTEVSVEGESLSDAAARVAARRLR